MSMIRPKQWSVSPTVQFGTPVYVSEHPLDELNGLVKGQINQMMTHARAPEWPIRTRLQGWV